MTDSSHGRRDIATAITTRILTSLEQGVMPWRKPWDSARLRPTLPQRANGEYYRGVNIIMLWIASAAHGYASPYWLTYKQAAQRGAHVRKGERGEIVVYYGLAQRREALSGDAHTDDAYRFLKTYVAFNADQIDGLSEAFYPRLEEAARTPNTAHERWFAGLDIERVHSGDIACYIPSRDLIAMPPLSAFDSTEAYAATLNHEAVHATGAAHRVGRDFSKRFDRHAVAAEELVAEIGAAILGAHLKLPPDHIADHAAYIGSWMSILRSDKRAFLSAAAHAQRAVDWLLDKSPPPEGL
ncbi:MAG TPA: zincin-like metallopeptidase domain-containing protein [Terricaulis sp.]|nr:zincin-like metallopeptidase domain-containing protein [Terricaulis sp.]